MRPGLLVVLLALALPAAAAAAPKPAAPRIQLAATKAVELGRRAEFRGRVVPARPYARVRLTSGSSVLGTASVRRDGSFYVSARLAAPGPYTARLRGVVSNPVRVLIRPLLRARLVGSRVVGEPLTLVAGVRPAAAGSLRVRVLRGDDQSFVRIFAGAARVELGTTTAAPLRIQLETVPRAGYAPRRAELGATLSLPDLRPGATGPAVVALADRLAQLGYLVPSRGPAFSWELRDSVYAFQKVQGLPRDGVVGQTTWRRLAHPVLPQLRYPAQGSHIEVDKTRQVLYVAKGGRIAQIIPVSTAGIAGYFTPVGRFAIYRKVPGWDNGPLGALLNPLYFRGGYAIHGNPSVPPYPASHGCVRIPNWVSTGFYSAHSYGETVYVY